MLLLGRIVAALISGALLAQAYSLNPFWPLAWIAPIPLLIAAVGAPRWSAFGLGALAGVLSMALMATYFVQLAGIGPTLVIALSKALIWGAVTLAVRGASQHLPAWAAVFVFPTLMAGIETLTAAISPHSTAGSLAYSQMDFSPAIQAAALGGVPAIVFVLSLFASAIVFLTGKRVLAAVVPALMVIAAIAYGYGRGAIESRDVPLAEAVEIKVALLAGDDFDFEAADWRPTWEAYINAAERALQDGARIVVVPEKIATIQAVDEAEATAQFAALAQIYEATIVVGAIARTPEAASNRAYFITPDGGTRLYDKQHMIPGLESEFTPGNAILFSDVGGVRIGVAVCKDMDFPDLARQYGAQGTALMLVPAWDFDRDAWLHSRMAILRGVENGFSIVRSARNGVMTVSDAYGHVSAQAASRAHVATLAASIVTPRHVPTLYTRIGDTFGWLCALLAAMLVTLTIRASRRAGQG